MQATQFHVATDHPAFAGHFPGQPLLPGVALLAEVLEVAMNEPGLAERIGHSPRLGAVKFLAPVRPGAALTLQFDDTPTAIRFEVRNSERVVASGHFERAT